jgi:hypothetical protein
MRPLASGLAQWASLPAQPEVNLTRRARPGLVRSQWAPTVGAHWQAPPRPGRFVNRKKEEKGRTLACLVVLAGPLSHGHNELVQGEWTWPPWLCFLMPKHFVKDSGSTFDETRCIKRSPAFAPRHSLASMCS